MRRRERDRQRQRQRDRGRGRRDRQRQKKRQRDKERHRRRTNRFCSQRHTFLEQLDSSDDFNFDRFYPPNGRIHNHGKKRVAQRNSWGCCSRPFDRCPESATAVYMFSYDAVTKTSVRLERKRRKCRLL